MIRCSFMYAYMHGGYALECHGLHLLTAWSSLFIVQETKSLPLLIVFIVKALNTNCSRQALAISLQGVLCVGACQNHIQWQEEKIEAALIKANGRVSSAVIPRLGATANQWTASAAIIINSSRSEKLEGNKKEWERLYQEASTTCAEQDKAGETETNTETSRPREQDCDSMVQTLEIYRFLV